mmetsp:Transcript_31483/g.61613  ORF Transcript_31483/g.61613 Transcript_31483/m.61613 type:complete len:278 (+) Transcript_31483:684-1517(+)
MDFTSVSNSMAMLGCDFRTACSRPPSTPLSFSEPPSSFSGEEVILVLYDSPSDLSQNGPREPSILRLLLEEGVSVFPFSRSFFISLFFITLAFDADPTQGWGSCFGNRNGTRNALDVRSRNVCPTCLSLTTHTTSIAPPSPLDEGASSSYLRFGPSFERTEGALDCSGLNRASACTSSMAIPPLPIMLIRFALASLAPKVLTESSSRMPITLRSLQMRDGRAPHAMHSLSYRIFRPDSNETSFDFVDIDVTFPARTSVCRRILDCAFASTLATSNVT